MSKGSLTGQVAALFLPVQRAFASALEVLPMMRASANQSSAMFAGTVRPSRAKAAAIIAKRLGISFSPIFMTICGHHCYVKALTIEALREISYDLRVHSRALWVLPQDVGIAGQKYLVEPASAPTFPLARRYKLSDQEQSDGIK